MLGDLATTLSMRRPRATVVTAPVLDDFEVGRFLGGGGMGIVFEGRDIVLDRRVALKFVHPDQRDCEAARARLLREAQALARVTHPNVVTLYTVGAGVDPFIAMELLDGTLRTWLDDRHAWQRIVDMFCAFGRGVAAVHELGLVHRDINPGNVFIDQRGTPKLGDFGLVLAEPADANCVLGTPAYMAPEQRLGAVDARADQYAFCVSLYEALVGELPDGDADLRAVPRPLRRVLARGLADDATARFPTMTALIEALADVS